MAQYRKVASANRQIDRLRKQVLWYDRELSAAKRTVARYVTREGYCRVCAGTGDRASGDPCPYCDGKGKPA
jgi:hypothetical protein